MYDENSEILILGSFPSVKSREMQFFYGHPQNRFWKVLAQVLNETVPQTIPEKKEMLLRHHIALWDVIASCDIAGSSDSSIRNVVPNDLAYIIGRSRITRIYANGAKSKQLYDKYLAKELGIEAVQLPSTSPANGGLQCGAAVGILAKNNKDTREREVEYACIYRRKEVYKDFMYIEGMCQRIKNNVPFYVKHGHLLYIVYKNSFSVASCKW